MVQVSVLMGVYNEPQVYVEKAVESILNQTLKNLELLIVVDNPEYQEIIAYLQTLMKKDCRINIMVNSENIGLARSLNRALECAQGVYIARMDADDIARPDRIERELQYMAERELDVVSCSADKIDENDEIWGEIRLLPNCGAAVVELLPVQNVIIHPTVVMKTEVLRAMNGYRNFSSCQDYDLWLRLLSSGYKIGILDEKLLYFRRHKNSVTATRRFNQILNEKYIRHLFRERIKNENQDSFTADNLALFLDKNGYNNPENVRVENQLLLEYQDGVKAIKKHKFLRAFFYIFHSMKSKAVRSNIRVSIYSKLIKIKYRHK